MPNKSATAYQETSILTADPGRLIIMCYEKAIYHLSACVDHYEKREYEAKAKNLQKAIDIISELNSCLDMKRGSDVARNLDALYKYMIQQLISADLHRHLDGFRHVIGMLRELDEAWREIALPKPQQTTMGKAVASTRLPWTPAVTAAVNAGRGWSA